MTLIYDRDPSYEVLKDRILAKLGHDVVDPPQLMRTLYQESKGEFSEGATQRVIWTLIINGIVELTDELQLKKSQAARRRAANG